MATKNIEFKVGIMVLLGLAILFGSLYWLQIYRAEQNAQRVTLRFADVGTLGPGDRVTVSGVSMGKVTDLTLIPNGVQVDLLLDKRVTLAKDSRFVIKNMGLMGERFIAIEPGADSELLDLSEIITGEYDSGLPEVMGLMGEMVVELRDLVSGLKKTVASDESLDKFNRTVSNLEHVSASIDQYMQRNESKLDAVADNFLSASKKLNTLVNENGTRVDSTSARFDRMSLTLEHLVYRLDTVSLVAKELASQIDSGDGTMQLLVNERQLYDDLRRTADNIDDLVTDIRANPERYIKIKVSLF